MRYKDATHDWIFISEEDAQKLIAHVSPRWRLAVRTLYTYGMRVSELISLTSENFKNGELVVKRLKKGRTTRQYIVPELRGDLDALVKSLPRGARLFPISRKCFWQNLQSAANRSGVDPKLAHAHAFRHACGRRWARIGTINEVSAMLGHRSIQATMMYSQLSCDADLSKKFLA
jgi:integrase